MLSTGEQTLTAAAATAASATDATAATATDATAASAFARTLKAKRIMHYAAEQAGMTLKHTAKSHLRANSSSGGSSGMRSLRDQLLSRDQGKGSFSDVSASAVVLIHEQEAAALTACIDPMKDVPTLRVRA
jgi:hypothetical protein